MITFLTFTFALAGITSTLLFNRPRLGLVLAAISVVLGTANILVTLGGIK